MGVYPPNNQGVIAIPLPHPWPLSLLFILFPFSPPYSRSLPSRPCPATKLPSWNQLRDLGSVVSSPTGVWSEATADIVFSVFWEEKNKKLIWQQLLYAFLHTENSTPISITKFTIFCMLKLNIKSSWTAQKWFHHRLITAPPLPRSLNNCPLEKK